MGCQGLDAFWAMVPGALRGGVTPVELKELVCRGTAYLGLGRTLTFLHAANEELAEEGVSLPLPPQGIVTGETRIEAGNQAQGGCEPQLISHAAANLRIGNDKAFLVDVVSQCLT